MALASYIDRWGVQAVMNRPYIGAGEARRIMLAENLISAYRERERSESWAIWAKDNPDKAELLNAAMIYLEEQNGG